MNLLIALLPALLWGVLPLVISKVGGRPIHQIIGTTTGTLLVAIVVYLIVQPNITTANFGWCFLSGAMWAGAQMLQYRSFELIGVSGGIPISTGMQLTANSVVGALFLGDWPTLGQRLVGFSAIAFIIFGIWLTTRRDPSNTTKKVTKSADKVSVGALQSESLQSFPSDSLRHDYGLAQSPTDCAVMPSTDGQSTSGTAANMKTGILVLAIGTIGYVGFSFFPARFHVDGRAAFLPQAIGMTIGALFFSLFYLKQHPFSRASMKNMLGGFIFAVAVLLYLISINLNGVSVAASLTQMNVILATLGGIYILGERKTRWELWNVYIGLFIVLIGGMMIGLTSTEFVADLL
jgi:putative sugar uptake protein EF_0928